MVDCRLKRNKSKKRCKILRRIRNKPRKNFNWKESKAKYPRLSRKGDVDKDKVKNKKDCRPFDKKRHVVPSPQYPLLGDELYVCPKIKKAVDIIRYGKDLGLDPKDTHKELQEKGYSGDEERNAISLYKRTNLGLNLIGSTGAC